VDHRRRPAQRAPRRTPPAGALSHWIDCGFAGNIRHAHGHAGYFVVWVVLAAGTITAVFRARGVPAVPLPPMNIWFRILFMGYSLPFGRNPGGPERRCLALLYFAAALIVL
jgi:hypothetical protein